MTFTWWHCGEAKFPSLANRTVACALWPGFSSWLVTGERVRLASEPIWLAEAPGPVTAETPGYPRSVQAVAPVFLK